MAVPIVVNDISCSTTVLPSCSNGVYWLNDTDDTGVHLDDAADARQHADADGVDGDSQAAHRWCIPAAAAAANHVDDIHRENKHTRAPTYT